MQQQGGGTLSVGDAIGYGWRAFTKYPGPLILISVVVWAVNVVFSGLGAAMGDAWAFRAVIQIVGWLITILLSLGLIRVALKVTRGEEPQVSDLFITDNYGVYLVTSVIFGIVMAVGLMLCIVPGIIWGIIFGFYGFAIVDRNDDLGGSFSRSSEITKGQRGTLFVLGLALIGINILGALLCGLGLLVSYPVTLVAGGYAYRVLSGEPVAPVPA
ncbi:MAG: hypothetical protein IPM45_04435 [Acidimicrobiales bacterium]|nr:hypothetical protein [Acidimicrobiales bacterium]